MAATSIATDACLREGSATTSVVDATNADAAETEPLGPIDLGKLIEIITEELTAAFRSGGKLDVVDLGARTRIAEAMQSLDTSSGCLEPFMHFDEHKCYTRNLIATDHETFTLLLLCWNGGKASPIHDHPCRGCWMRVCEGTVFETRFADTVKGEGAAELPEGETYTYNSPQVAYVHDSMGLHRVGAAAHCERACTLHLYAPPYDTCRVWLDAAKPDRVLQPVVTFYSEYGEIVDYTPDRFAPAITDDRLCSATASSDEGAEAWRAAEPPKGSERIAKSEADAAGGGADQSLLLD